MPQGHNIASKYSWQKTEHESDQASISNYNQQIQTETLDNRVSSSSKLQRERGREGRAYRLKRDLVSTNCNVGILFGSQFLQIQFKKYCKATREIWTLGISGLKIYITVL